MSYAPSPSPVPAVVATIALFTTTLSVIGAALFGTVYELGICVVAMAVVIVAIWRWVR